MTAESLAQEFAIPPDVAKAILEKVGQDTKRLNWLQTHMDAEDVPKVYFQPTRWAGTIRAQIDKYSEEIPF